MPEAEGETLEGDQQAQEAVTEAEDEDELIRQLEEQALAMKRQLPTVAAAEASSTTAVAAALASPMFYSQTDSGFEAIPAACLNLPAKAREKAEEEEVA